MSATPRLTSKVKIGRLRPVWATSSRNAQICAPSALVLAITASSASPASSAPASTASKRASMSAGSAPEASTST